LLLKDICAAKNKEKNNFVYEKCSLIIQIAEDASFIKKNFILFNVAPTRFASTIMLLKKFKLFNTDMDVPTIHMVYEICDSMFKK
ncbi:hypothetical protein S245_007816, partial [Arachis hypogaea]